MPDAVHLGHEAKIRLPNVDEVLDLGYALHASDDEILRDTEVQKFAKQIVARFMATDPKNDTETAYLAAAQGIALAYGRAISRRKIQWKDSLETARRERGQELERMRESSRSNAWYLTLLWKLLPPAVLVMTGIVVAQTSERLPDDLTKTLTWLISFAVGGAFALVGRYIGLWWSGTRRDTVEMRYSQQLFQAHILYEQKKAEEHAYYRKRMCESWLQYTGEEYPNTASYGMVMAGDIETRKEIEQQRVNYNRTTIWLLRKLVRILRGKRKGEPEEIEPPRPVLREL